MPEDTRSDLLLNHMEGDQCGECGAQVSAESVSTLSESNNFSTDWIERTVKALVEIFSSNCPRNSFFFHIGSLAKFDRPR